MTDPNGELAAYGEMAKAIPAKAWEKLVATACTTFEQTLAPLTATTSGTGRWIAAKFDRLIQMEKINAAAAFELAKEKIHASGKALNPNPEPKIIILALEGAAAESNEDLRELWANLIAREFTAGGVHPTIPRILADLTPKDAEVLSRVATFPQPEKRDFLIQSSIREVPDAKDARWLGIEPEEVHMSLTVLDTLGITSTGVQGDLTSLGDAFIEAVGGKPSK